MATKIEEALEIIKGMTILELRDLNNAIEEEFGITAAAPVAVAAVAGGEAGGDAGGGGAKTEFDVVLKGFGDNKIAVIKAVREVVSGLGLKEAKELVEGAPTKVREGVSQEEADEAKAKLEEAGAEIGIE